MVKAHSAPQVRASWSGMLRFGLVSFSVQAINTRLPEQGKIRFNQLHAECHRRIRYEKVCPEHGPVKQEEIVSGYQHTRGQYVEIDPDELDALRTERERALVIDTFIEPAELDPLWLDGRTYYLAPDADEAFEPYALLHEAMKRREKYGIGQVVFSGREQLALVRPYEQLLVMSLLSYGQEMRALADVAPALPAPQGVERQLRLAMQLVDAWSDEAFDYSQYENPYVSKVQALIDSKIAGREVVAPPANEEPEVINLMDALRKSVAQAKEGRPNRKGRSTPAVKRTAKAKKRRAS